MSVFTRFKSALVSENFLLAEEILKGAPTLANHLDSHGSSMLHYAVFDENFTRAAWLVEHGWPYEHGLLGLFRAKGNGERCFVEDLCRSLDSAEAMPETGGKSFFELAIAERNIAWVDYVFGRGWAITNAQWISAGVAAIKNFDQEVLASILDGTSVPPAAMIEMGSEAIIRNRMHAFGLLLEAGLPVEAVDSKGFSLLNRASAMGRIECAKTLLDLGSEIDRFDDNGRTALYLAVSNGREEMVEFLLKHGAIPDKRQGVNGQGDSPARLATKSSAGKVRQLFAPLLEHAVLSSMESNVAPKVLAKRL